MQLRPKHYLIGAGVLAVALIASIHVWRAYFRDTFQFERMVQLEMEAFRTPPGGLQTALFERSRAYRQQLLARGVLKEVTITREDIAELSEDSRRLRAHLTARFGVYPQNLSVIRHDRNAHCVEIVVCDRPARIPDWIRAIEEFNVDASSKEVAIDELRPDENDRSRLLQSAGHDPQQP